MIIDEEKDFYIDPIDIKIEVLTKINKDNLVFNKKYRNDEVEKMKMPLFTPFLLEMIYNSDEIPSFIEFFNEYCDKNLENIESIILPLKLRLSKAYVSVIRELYIRCFLKKNGFNVKYNYDDDVNHDIDMWVEVNGEEIPVALFLKSEYSRVNREHKYLKRIPGLEYYDFEYENDDTNRNDCVYFPYEEDLYDLIKNLKNGY